MAYYLRILGSFCLVLVATAFIQPPLEQYFQEQGWHDYPLRALGGIVNWVLGIVGHAAVPWIASGIIGFNMGMWLHYLASIRDRKTLTKSEKFQYLHDRIHNMRNGILTQKQHWTGKMVSPQVPTGIWAGNIAGQYMSIASEFKKIRLKIPPPKTVFKPDDWEEKSNALVSFLAVMEGLSQYGNVDEARKVSRDLTRKFTNEFGKR